MVRATIIAALAFATAMAASAGEIQIGGASGLTSSYLTSAGGGASCYAGAGNCITGSTGGFAEKNYDNVLFSGATNGTPPVPFSGYTQTGGEGSGLTATSAGNATSASGVTFAMISDGAASNNASKNFWEASSANSTITVPIGVYDVSDVATMLQNVWGSVGGNDTDITFNFGTASNLANGPSVTFDLLDVNNQPQLSGGTANGEIRSSTGCTTTTTAACNLGTSPSNIPLQTTTLTGSDSNTYTVNTAYVFGAKSTFGGQYNYTSVSPNTGLFANTTGALKLDDQDFVFGTDFAKYYLVSIGVTQTGTYGSGVSATALSAITVDTAAPEPTTIILVLAGLGGIVGARRFRRA